MTLPISHPDHHNSDHKHYGYIDIDVKGRRAVTRDWAASSVALALNGGTLHEWAALQPVREEMYGRGVIYSVELPTMPPTPVVVRRNRHGGLLHSITGEYFVSPTRAPLELATSLRLIAAGIPTPEVIAYAVYPIAGIFARSDVVTRRLPEGADLPVVWKKARKEDRDLLLKVVASLLKSLVAAGAWHADLNLKNIYIAGNDGKFTAYLLDVDRVTFPRNSDVAARNLSRLTRSVRKWRERWELDFDEAALARLAELSREN